MSVQALLAAIGKIVYDWTVWNNLELGLAHTYFHADGTTTGNQGTDTPAALANWYTPTTGGIGASRWIEFNRDGVWLSLSTTQSAGSDGTTGTTFTIPFRLSTTNSAAGAYRAGYISATGGGA